MDKMNLEDMMITAIEQRTEFLRLLDEQPLCWQIKNATAIKEFREKINKLRRDAALAPISC